MKKTQKYTAILALVLPIALGACGGSKSDSGSAVLKAADLDVSVSCDDWAQVDIFGEANCTTTIKNNSSASGTVFISWLWMIGDRKCGLGSASKADPNGVPYFINIEANDTGFLTTAQRVTCAVFNGGPEATEINIRVRK